MEEKEIIFLVEKAKKNDSEAFTTLIQFYMKDMYKVGIAILKNDTDIADALQETILTCWEKIDALRKVEYFKTWLIRILINECYQLQRKSKYYSNYEEVQEIAYEDSHNWELKEALHILEEKYRIVVILYYVQGYKIEEISKLLRIPKSTIQTRLFRARKQLEIYYGKGGKR